MVMNNLWQVSLSLAAVYHQPSQTPRNADKCTADLMQTDTECSYYWTDMRLLAARLQTACGYLKTVSPASACN